MTSITVGLDEALVARLTERAEREGVTVEELASRALAEYLTEEAQAGQNGGDGDPFAWMGKYGNAEAQSARIDDLLSEGFGQ